MELDMSSVLRSVRSQYFKSKGKLCEAAAGKGFTAWKTGLF
jgi:hypothetical protein